MLSGKFGAVSHNYVVAVITQLKIEFEKSDCLAMLVEHLTVIAVEAFSNFTAVQYRYIVLPLNKDGVRQAVKFGELT